MENLVSEISIGKNVTVSENSVSEKKLSVSVSVKILVSSISDCSECFYTAHDFCGPHFCMEWCTVHSRQRAGHRTDVVEKDLLPSQPSPTANLSQSTHIEKPLFKMCCLHMAIAQVAFDPSPLSNRDI